MLVETKNLTKVYGDKMAVNSLDIQIERGSFTAILSPNGAGKSTTIQMLIGLLQPTSGQIIYAEETKRNNFVALDLTIRENERLFDGSGTGNFISYRCKEKQIKNQYPNKRRPTMKINLFNHKQRTPMAQKISKEEIEKTRLGCASSQYYFWLQYSH